MNLSEYYFLKSFKYIRREWRNGRWRYWYEDIKGSIHNGKFGRILKEYIGDPSGAFKRLFKDKRGQAYDVVTLKLPALYIDENGKFKEATQPDGEKIYVNTSIDMVWGSSGVGLFHILLRHFVQQRDFSSIKEAEEVISSNLKNFEKDESSYIVQFEEEKQSFIITTEDKKLFVIAVEQDMDSTGEQAVRHFILTSYDTGLRKKKNSKTVAMEKYEQIKRREY